jgi:hypothetical protein
LRIWSIRPARLAATCFKEVRLSTTFTRRVIASFHATDWSLVKSEEVSKAG